MTELKDLHYLELDFGEQAAEMRSALFSHVHSFNVKNSAALGIDCWRSLARVFGSADALSSFVEQTRIQRMLALCTAFRPIAAVPTTDRAVSLTRHRPATRTQPSRLRRFAERNPDVGPLNLAPVRCDLVVPMRSTSTQQDFLLKLCRKDTPLTPVVKFNAYGLCAEGTSVPLF